MKAWVVLGLLVCGLAFGEAATEVPGWLQMVMDFIVAIPLVGPVILEVLKWLGVVSAVATALSTGLLVISKAFQAMGQAMGFVAFAEKVDAIYRQVWPYLSWLSVYNAKKKQ